MVAAIMKKILMIDGHEVARVGLKYILEEAIPASILSDADTAQAALRLVAEQEWDLVLLELSLDGNRGLEVLKEIKRRRPHMPVLIVSGYAEKQYAFRAIKAGAAGYFSKNNDAAELVTAARRVLQGGRYVSLSLAETLSADVHRDGAESVSELLSDREFQVMRFIGSGKTVGEIAKVLSLSDKTVSTYRARILEKTGLKNNAEMLRYVAEQGLLD
jgi:DNA-binding NarL/FixJ family response regulator